MWQLLSLYLATPQKKPPVPVDNLKSKIITLLESGAKSSRTIADTLHCENTQLHTVLKHLLEQKIITITQTNTYKLSHL
jgi:ATP-dependent DNA helicase RecQ